MASYADEFQGRAECGKCRRTNRAEWRLNDRETGQRVGTLEIAYDCDCVRPSDRREPRETETPWPPGGRTRR